MQAHASSRLPATTSARRDDLPTDGASSIQRETEQLLRAAGLTAA
jgi:hypothetical protein